MALFFNHRKPRPFNYKPRYYSPEKEALEERKKIVLGEKYKAPGEESGDREYVPGEYIRRQTENRRGNLENEMFRRRKRKRKRQSMTLLAFVLTVLVFIVWMLYFR